MGNNREFFREKKPAAIFKHKLLEDYLAPWAAKLGSFNPQGLAFVDGYAGSGRYDANEEGSPVIAMKAARKLGSSNLRCVFVEKLATNAGKLAQVVLHEGHGLDVVGPLHGTLEDRVDDVLGAIEGRPALVFLDPFGTALSADLLVDKILCRPGRSTTEVLLNFNIEAVWRFGGFLNSQRAMAGVHGKATLDTADRFLGGDWWHDSFRNARRAMSAEDEYRTAAEAAMEVAERYAQMISDKAGVQALSVPVRRERTTQPFFSLMLFHSHDAAKLPFIDAAARAHRNWRHAHWDRYAEKHSDPMALFDLDTLPDRESEDARLSAEAVQTIEENLRALLAETSTLPLGQHMEAVFGLTLGTAGASELRKAVGSLYRAGFVEKPPARLDRAILHRA
jgi:three-Cys-motif partner protein